MFCRSFACLFVTFVSFYETGMADYGEELKDVQPRRRMPYPATSSSYQEDHNSML